MEIFRVREELKYKSIREIPLRVTYYARVSSERDEQLNSLKNQTQYYEDYIKSNPRWTYVEGYVDAANIIGLRQNPTKRVSL